jgi:DNA-binding transcriptional MerR regulator
MKAGLTIGELAKELHLNPKTVRYYEELGLLPNPQRSESGYRLYSRHEVDRLHLIRRAKLLRLSLAEIKELVEYAIDGHCSALEHRLLSLVETKLGEIDQKIRDLSTFRKELMQYQCDLSARLASAVQEVLVPATPTPCHCIGEAVDKLRK